MKRIEWRMIWGVLKVVGALAATSLVWSCAYWIFVAASDKSRPIAGFNPSDLITTLFGASSIALFILSFLVAVVATLGWQSLKDHISKKVGEEVKKKTKSLENELKGRVATVLGHVLGEMSLKPNSFDEVDNKDRLEHAVGLCKEGDRYLQKVGGAAAALGLNNYLFYRCVLDQDNLDKVDEDIMLEGARLLRKEGAKHDSPMLLLTACRIFLHYPSTPTEKTKAKKILQDLMERSPKVSARERSEALAYHKRFQSLEGQ